MLDPREDLAEAYYASDATYAEQLTPPLGLSSVFEYAREKQLTIRDVVIPDLSPESLQKVQAVMNQETSLLDEVAISEGLMSRPVTMTGLSVTLPSHRFLLETNMSLVQTLEEGPAVEELAVSHETAGQFFGFGTRYEVIPDGDTIGAVRPVLVYQIKVGGYQSPLSAGMAFAIGDVGEAQIEFIEDITKQKVMELLTVLMSYPDATVVSCVNNINSRLAKKEVYTAGDMRYIGYQINTLLSKLGADPLEGYCDAVVDLVSCYVDLEKKYVIAIDSILRMPRTENGMLSGEMEYIQGSPLISISGVVAGFTVMQNYALVRGELKLTHKNTIYAVMHSPEAAWYLRLTELENFKAP